MYSQCIVTFVTSTAESKANGTVLDNGGWAAVNFDQNW